MGSVPRCSWPELVYPMGEIAEDLPFAQSDSDASSSSIDAGETSETLGNRCKWTGCGRCFGHLDLLASHVTRVHAECGQGGLFYCGWEGCTRGNRGFNARYKMLVHVRTHTNEKPHQCFKCEKSFSRAENLKIHARSHTGERPYVCPIPGCGKAYSNSSDRFKHTRTHSVDKPYMCKVPGCSKRYTDPSSLRKHVKTYRHYQNINQDNSTNNVPQKIESPITFPNIERKNSESEEERKESSIESSNDRVSFPKNLYNTNEYYANNLDEDSGSLNVIHPVDSTNYGIETFQFHQWPRPEYNLFCSWLNLWNKTLKIDQEQDLPLDLTMHHGNKTEGSQIC